MDNTELRLLALEVKFNELEKKIDENLKKMNELKPNRIPLQSKAQKMIEEANAKALENQKRIAEMQKIEEQPVDEIFDDFASFSSEVE